jgi:Fe-S-cluster containining protein
MIQANVQLTLGNEPIDVEFVVPSGRAHPLHLLPMIQKLANDVVDGCSRQVEAQGKEISCKAGCGACCRQMVPIGEHEAHYLAHVVDQMPPERQEVVRQRFSAGLSALRSAGIPLSRQEIPASREGLAVGVQYFHQGIACPFLEDESCSIHPDRPLACREYLVTSPSDWCAAPDRHRIDGVTVPRKSWVAFALTGSEVDAELPWIPMITALEFAQENSVEVATKSGPELVQEFIERLTGAQVPSPTLGPG